MSNKKFTILGKSNCSVAMILENLFLLFKDDFSVEIIKNMEDSTDLKYIIPNIQICEFDITNNAENIENEINSNKCILGAFRTNSKLAIYTFFKKYNIKNEQFYTIISSESYVASTCSIGNGCIINHKCVIDSFSEINNFVTINRCSSVGHHTIIGEFTTINPNCHIAGNCKIGKNVQIGMSCTIIDGLTIGDNSIIGANSFVNKDVPSNVLVYGNPAKIIRNL